MPITTLPIANGFYLSESLPISAQECTNWYPNIVQTEGLNNETLFGTPGLEQLATSGLLDESNRAAQTMAGIPYFVNGNSLYRLNRSTVDSVVTYDLEVLGLVEGEGRVSIANNGTQLMLLVPGGKGYIFTESPDTFAEITDVDFRANGDPQIVVYIDGYFVCTTDSKKFITSSLNNGLSYNALDFGTAEADPDDIVAPIVFKNQLFIGGASTMEAFENIGGADFPFVRTGLFLDKGIDSAFSIIVTSDTFMFIGGGLNESPAIWAFAGNTVQKVSTTAIDSILQRVTQEELEQAFSWSYAQKGAYFIGFSLPDTTLVFDTVTQRWHERKSKITDVKGAVNTLRFRANSVITGYGLVLCGDSQDGRVGSLDPDVYDEYGINIIRRVATQPFQNNMESFTVPSLELTVESGVGNDAVDDPQIMLDISLDGKNFSYVRARSLGKKGEYTKRAIWRRNGRIARFSVFRFTLSDAVKPVVIQLTADVV